MSTPTTPPASAGPALPKSRVSRASRRRIARLSAECKAIPEEYTVVYLPVDNVSKAGILYTKYIPKTVLLSYPLLWMTEDGRSYIDIFNLIAAQKPGDELDGDVMLANFNN